MLASVFVSWVSLPCDVCGIATYEDGKSVGLGCRSCSYGVKVPGPTIWKYMLHTSAFSPTRSQNKCGYVGRVIVGMNLIDIVHNIWRREGKVERLAIIFETSAPGSPGNYLYSKKNCFILVELWLLVRVFQM